MKYAIISYPGSINMGDEVQSLATADLLPRVDYYLPREHLHQNEIDEPVKLICNGWFMQYPQNWPPADNIRPLFISLHVTQSNKSARLMVRKELVDYYRQFEPIGCRDYNTVRLFESIGVKAYYSSCITLTLSNKFKERNDRILLVDPLRHNYTRGYRDYIVNKMVPEKYRDSVEVVNQRRTKIDAPVEERFKDAEKLIEMYSKAKLVITSRIHCALPCLALGTPVYFINAGYHSRYLNLNDRLDGILELMNVVGEEYFPYGGKSLYNFGIRILNLYKNAEIKPLPIDWENPEPNPEGFKPYAELIKEKIRNFL